MKSVIPVIFVLVILLNLTMVSAISEDVCKYNTENKRTICHYSFIFGATHLGSGEKLDCYYYTGEGRGNAMCTPNPESPDYTAKMTEFSEKERDWMTAQPIAEEGGLEQGSDEAEPDAAAAKTPTKVIEIKYSLFSIAKGIVSLIAMPIVKPLLELGNSALGFTKWFLTNLIFTGDWKEPKAWGLFNLTKVGL